MLISFVHKEECVLCDEAWETLQKVQKDYDFTVERIDIKSDAEAYERWWQDIPVILINGEEHAHWFLKEAEFRAALDEAKNQSLLPKTNRSPKG